MTCNQVIGKDMFLLNFHLWSLQELFFPDQNISDIENEDIEDLDEREVSVALDFSYNESLVIMAQGDSEMIGMEISHPSDSPDTSVKYQTERSRVRRNAFKVIAVLEESCS